MADKKSPKTPTKNSAEKSLAEQLVEAKQQLLDAKKSLAAGELVNPRVVGAYRKEIARIMTKINHPISKKEGK